MARPCLKRFRFTNPFAMIIPLNKAVLQLEYHLLNIAALCSEVFYSLFYFIVLVAITEVS
jgi:hypothetical protein